LINELINLWLAYSTFVFPTAQAMISLLGEGNDSADGQHLGMITAVTAVQDQGANAIGLCQQNKR